VCIENIGPVPGSEVAQLYITFPDGAGEPPNQLRGFHKTQELKVGANETVTFEISARDRSVFEPESGQWREVKGVFHWGIGAASDDPQTRGTFTN
jgi:beta-glucosidase